MYILSPLYYQRYYLEACESDALINYKPLHEAWALEQNNTDNWISSNNTLPRQLQWVGYLIEVWIRFYSSSLYVPSMHAEIIGKQWDTSEATLPGWRGPAAGCGKKIALFLGQEQGYLIPSFRPGARLPHSMFQTWSEATSFQVSDLERGYLIPSFRLGMRLGENTLNYIIVWVLPSCQSAISDLERGYLILIPSFRPGTRLPHSKFQTWDEARGKYLNYIIVWVLPSCQSAIKWY